MHNLAFNKRVLWVDVHIRRCGYAHFQSHAEAPLGAHVHTPSRTCDSAHVCAHASTHALRMACLRALASAMQQALCGAVQVSVQQPAQR